MEVFVKGDHKIIWSDAIEVLKELYLTQRYDATEATARRWVKRQGFRKV